MGSIDDHVWTALVHDLQAVNECWALAMANLDKAEHQAAEERAGTRLVCGVAGGSIYARRGASSWNCKATYTHW